MNFDYLSNNVYNLNMAEKTVNEKLSEVYYSETGYSSLANTYKDVKNKYPNITYKEVRDW